MKKCFGQAQSTEKNTRTSRKCCFCKFFSDIPLVDAINELFEFKPGVADIYNHNKLFNVEEMCGFIDQLATYTDEFSPPTKGDKENPTGFYWENSAFTYSDAMSYYCVIRHFQPEHIVEVGSGCSTFVADHALKKNGKGKVTLIEPYPMFF